MTFHCNTNKGWHLVALVAIIHIVTEASAFVVAPPSFSTASRSITSKPSIHQATIIHHRQSRPLFLSADPSQEIDGPELWRMEGLPGPKDQLVEYVKEWSTLMMSNTKLITPIRVENTSDGVKLVFKSTKTGSAYMSRKEERAREEETGRAAAATSSSTAASPPSKKQKLDGGVQVMVEDKGANCVVIAKRCNVDEDTTIKEMSEETIVSRLKEALKIWKKDHS